MDGSGTGVTRRGFMGGVAAAGALAAATTTRRADAAIGRVAGIPNVLVVDGIDPSTEYRPALQSLLYGSEPLASPVRRGTHDFWMCFPYPSQPDGNPTSPNFGYGDAAARSVLRGIGDMRSFPAGVSADEIQGRLFTLLHESAHAWLVPADMRVKIGGSDVAPYLADELTAALNAEAPLVRPALLARQNAHWSCYVNFDSCMDSVQWDRAPAEGGYVKWTQSNPPLTPVAPPGLTTVQTNAVYSDLDLYFMGMKRAGQCFPQTGGQFYWLEPKLSLGAPMQYLAGLFVAFSRTDYVYLGFYNDHGKLRVERSATSDRSDIVDIGTDYHPMRSEYDAMMLRVVKRGTTYVFQACRGNSASAVLSGRGPFMFDEVDNLGAAPTSGGFGRWQTIATWTLTAPPQAIGVITKTWNPILAEGEFFTFETRVGNRNDALTLFDANGTTTPGQALASLPSDRLLRDVPQAGALFRRRNFAMIMGVPYTSTYDHWAGVDNAPKLMARAPSGDFAFGVTAKVHRSLVSPWAGGAAVGMTMFGVERSARVSDVVVPPRISRDWATAPATYKNAFIIVTNQGRQLRPQDVLKVDVLRRYYDAALAAVSGGLMRSISTL